mgnify:CR=1 FL=1
MHRYLIPDERVRSIYDIQLDRLKEKGIYSLIIDLDNTLTAWNSPEVSPALRQWVKRAKSEGFKICLLSNNGEKRVEKYAKELDIIPIWKAGKPGRRGFRKALEHLGCKEEDCAVIGDQIFTDMIGGNRVGLYTILVTPIARKEFIGTRLVRLLEGIVLKRLGD